MTVQKKEDLLKGFGPKGLTPWVLSLLALLFLGHFVMPAMNQYWADILLYAGINVILAVSLNLIFGFTGQFSIGHAGFMAVGAYTSAMITLTCTTKYPEIFSEGSWGLSFLFLASLVAAGILAALAGYLVGLPSLRLRGDYLAIVTLGFGEIIRVLLLNIDAVGGARGLPGIPLLTNFSLLYAIVVLTIFVIWRIVHSRFGRAFLAIREDEIAAEAMGVNTTMVKVRAFVIGSFFAGVGGGLFAHKLQIVTPAVFDFNRSFEVIIMVVLGGMGSISGSLVAAIFLTGLKEALRPLMEITQLDFRMIIYSLVLIVLMLTRPNGIFGTMEINEVLRRFSRKRLNGGSNNQGSKVSESRMTQAENVDA